MLRPTIMPTPHELMLFELLFAQEQKLSLLTSLVGRALPTAGIQGSLGNTPIFDRMANGPTFHISKNQNLPMLTREGVLSDWGPKFRAAYAAASTPEEWKRLWKQLEPVSAEQFGRTMFDVYFNSPWHADQTHSWITPDMTVNGRMITAEHLPLYWQIYEFFETAKDVPLFGTEEARVAFYNQPNSKTSPALFRSGQHLWLAIPVRHYNDTVITSSHLPFHSAYLLFLYDEASRGWSRLGAAHWCEIEGCWLEDFQKTEYLTTDEITRGVETFEQFFNLPKYEPVLATEVQQLYAKIGEWIDKRSAGITQTRRVKPEFARFYNWRETLRVGRLMLEIPDGGIYIYPELTLYREAPAEDTYTPRLNLKMFVYGKSEYDEFGRKSIWSGTQSLPPRRLYKELVALLTAWLEAAEKGEFDKHEFKAWNHDDNSVTDPNLFYYEHDPAREPAPETTPPTT